MNKIIIYFTVIGMCILINPLKAAFGSAQFLDSGQKFVSSCSQDIALGDLDGDGDLDAFVTGPGELCFGVLDPNKVWLNDGAGYFSDSGQSLGDDGRSVALGDLDGDGDLDAFVAIRACPPDPRSCPNMILLNDGSGHFSDSGQRIGRSFSNDIALDDLDGDGDLDAFVANWGPNKVWLNDGAGYFSDSGQSLGDDDDENLALGDLDGDGDLDAFVTTWDEEIAEVNTVWLNDGTGKFIDSGQNLEEPVWAALALGDLDDDNDLDVFVARNWGESSQVWLNDGAGYFSDSGQSLGGDGEGVALGDLDGDGDLDAFVAVGCSTASPVCPNMVWLNDGSGHFSDSGQSLGSSWSNDIALGDLDGDGDLDAFVANSGPDKVWINNTAIAGCRLSSKFKETIIINGMRYYTDRTYKITSVPSVYVGMKAILTPNDDRNLKTCSDYLTFTIINDGDVYVAYDSRANALPNWLRGFTFTGHKIYTSLSTQPCLKVYRKSYQADDCVKMGANKACGFRGETVSNYIVFYNKENGGPVQCALESKFETTPMQIGVFYYTDRSYTITGGVPDWMLGRTLIQTPNDERNNTSDSGYIRFTNPVDWWVYVLFDSRSASIPDWLNGWERYTKYPDIETSLSTQPGLKMFRKMFDAGQCVDLGGNYGPGSSGEYRSNYAVVYGK